MVDPKLIIPRQRWFGLLAELHRRGHNRHESGAFLLGSINGRRRQVEDVVFYDELDRHAYSSGVCILEADSFETLWRHCRTTGLAVLADIHTHPGAARQSRSDRENPMIARAGHLALIAPEYARGAIWRHQLGVYRYTGAHQWTDFSGWKARSILKTGTWR